MLKLDEHLASCEAKLDIARELVRGVLQGGLTALFIRGEPGIGKSHVTMEELSKSRRSYKRYTGHITPLQTFYALGDNPGHGSLVMFDDCDAVFGEAQALNILKAAVDTKTIREVRWVSSARTKYDRFVFEGAVIVLTNADFKSPHYKALIDRVHLYDLKLTREEKIAKLYQIATTLPDIEADLGMQVAAWIVTQTEKRGLRLSFRTLPKVMDLAKFSKNWRFLAEHTAFDDIK